jgi:hypothetical protein
MIEKTIEKMIEKMIEKTAEGKTTRPIRHGQPDRARS